ncbi:MAG: radical SAM protein [Gammaproteobacteria bacterium]|nr:radical SAM protein [Pseudomonadales bacterium]
MNSDPLKLKEIPSGTAPFTDPEWTAKGEPRASVYPQDLTTLWINTGSLCNLACEHCYIESTPTNDRLSYISTDEVRGLLDEIAEQNFPTGEIGFTGGEPFLNDDFLPILSLCLERGFRVLVLTNAMNTMLRHDGELTALRQQYGERLKLRVSLDHYTEARHASERGKRSWKPAIRGLRWLSENGFSFSVAGRTFWDEEETSLRRGYAQLFERETIALDADDESDLVLFPEMDTAAQVPEITTSCWGILNKDPADMMCASSRMVVKHKGDDHLSVMACTLLPYDQRFNLGKTLSESWQPVRLNHPHCAKFCVLGGGSCSQ